MTPHDYLKNRLETCSQYQLTEVDENYIKENSLKDFLFKQMTRKKFRKWKLPDLARERIDASLDHCIPQEKPIIFRFRFGGYKLWRFPSTPEVDWAEFFAIAHFCEYLAPLIATYKPGIKFHFNSDDVFVERLDNIPKADTEAYYNSFQKLLDEFRKYLPDNFEVDMIRHSSLYKSEEEFEQEFQVKVDEIEDTWRQDVSQEKLEAGIKTSIMNIKWDGVEDLTKLSESAKQAKIEQSVMYHDALVKMPTIRAFSDQPDKIAIFATPLASNIAIGTTKNSIVRFWVGTGILEKKGDSYADRILSIQQYKKISDLPYEEVDIDFVPLKNFKSLKVYNESLDFNK